MDEKFLLIEAGTAGPIVYRQATLEAIVGLLVMFHRGCDKAPTLSAWKKKRGTWVPIWGTT